MSLLELLLLPIAVAGAADSRAQVGRSARCAWRVRDSDDVRRVCVEIVRRE